MKHQDIVFPWSILLQENVTSEFEITDSFVKDW